MIESVKNSFFRLGSWLLAISRTMKKSMRMESSRMNRNLGEPKP